SRFEALAGPIEREVHLQGDAQLVRAFPVPNQIVPAGRATLIAQTAMVTPAYVNVPIKIEIDGTFIREIFVGYRVERFVKTAVATRDLVPGTVLSPSDLRIARVLYTGQSTNGVSALIGRKVIATVRAGAAVPIEITQVDQIVKAGNTVTLIVSDGGVSVVADVVARSSGGLGEMVSVYNPQTNKMLTGTVVGPDRVELNLTGDVQ
ncbi:MAG TPA: flagellar basal body P-ring formation chaperone FlgA, partial [Candidatus Aquilonibacter sp.]